VRRCGLVALVLAAGALAGCGDSGSSEDRTALEDALASVAAGDASKTYFEWGDTGRLADIAKVPPDGASVEGDDRFFRVAARGFGQLAETSSTLPDTAGIKPFGADSAVTIGVPPQTATRLSGTDAEPEAAGAKLRAAGAEEVEVDGHTLLALGEEGNSGIDRLDKFGGGLGRQFDRVAIEDDAIALGPYEEPVVELLGGSPSLLEEKDFAAGAACLGDVRYAILAPADERSRLEKIPGSPALVAVGGRIDGQLVDEVACVIYDDEGAADEEATRMRKTMAPEATLPSTREPLGDIIASTEVDTVEADERFAARAVMRLNASRPPSFIVDAFFRGDVGPLLGSGVTPFGASGP
jgi:hypothetical protein